MKKSNISRVASLFFLACLVVTIRYFDDEAATMFAVFAVIAFVSSLVYAKLNL